jgi:2-polyprenyl-6-hydroxyphenyl methylase/3-demethylubiquinone-9 3-methyltransferase
LKEASLDSSKKSARSPENHTESRSPGGQAASVDAGEVANFEAMADSWWDPEGLFKPLHRINPVRLSYIGSTLARHFGRDMAVEQPLSGLHILDVGCGGGLVCEPLARMGANVLGIDPSEKNIHVAAAHAANSDLAVDYRFITAEELAASGHRFDAVLALEVVEHVADLESFLAACQNLVAAGGPLIFSTINRTPKAFVTAIIGAEYVLRWLPRGTHDWRKFLKPSELARHLRSAGLGAREFRGMSYRPFADRWSLSDDLSVNYLGYASRTVGS